jgi:hypothetical protein
MRTVQGNDGRLVANSAVVLPEAATAAVLVDDAAADTT